MAHTFPPAPDRPDGPAGDAQPTPQMAKRSTPRSLLRSALPRLIVLAVTLALLVGVFALVHANTSAGAPVRSVSSTTGAHTTGVQTSSRAASAPDFALPTLGGGAFHLARKLGHVVVLFFMATGCAGCEPPTTCKPWKRQWSSIRTGRSPTKAPARSHPNNWRRL